MIHWMRWLIFSGKYHVLLSRVFMGFLSWLIAAVFLVWAYTPEPWLHALGITYYPSKWAFFLQFSAAWRGFSDIFIFSWYFLQFSLTDGSSIRYWALAVPAYAIMAIVLSLAFYLGLNFISTPPPTSFATLFGKLIVNRLYRLGVDGEISTLFF